MKTLYLLIDFFTVIVPLLFSFHPQIKFYTRWKEFFIASAFAAIIFIAWDVFFTSEGVWSFNQQYITGLYFFNLPIEEILFFFCIPFSCVFTYYCLDKFYKLNWRPAAENSFCIFFSAGLFIAGFLFHEKLYTSVTFLSTALLCVLLKFVFRISWFGKAISVYAILLVPFLVVNGILTAKPVVMYNDREILGIRLFTIPAEDIIYGLELFLVNLSFFLFLSANKKMEKK
jgi:lycopene cyclase domain-containing protein